MPKKQPKRKEVTFVGYVRTQVDQAAKDWVKANLLKEEQIVPLVAGWASAGYKVSVQWRDEDEAFTVGLYCMEHGHENAGLMLTARHSNLIKAYTLLTFLHTVKYNEAWPEYQDSSQNLDW